MTSVSVPPPNVGCSQSSLDVFAQDQSSRLWCNCIKASLYFTFCSNPDLFQRYNCIKSDVLLCLLGKGHFFLINLQGERLTDWFSQWDVKALIRELTTTSTISPHFHRWVRVGRRSKRMHMILECDTFINLGRGLCLSVSKLFTTQCTLTCKCNVFVSWVPAIHPHHYAPHSVFRLYQVSDTYRAEVWWAATFSSFSTQKLECCFI